MGFDIAVKEQELAAEDLGVVIKILDAAGEPALADDGSPVTWTVCGINSKQYRKATLWQRKVFQALGGRKMTGDEALDMQSEFVARCSKSFSGFTENGAPLSFSVETATNILSRLPFIQRQVEQAMGDHAGFTKQTSTT